MKTIALSLIFISRINAFAPVCPNAISQNPGLQMTPSTVNNEDVTRRVVLKNFIASSAFLTAAVPSIASAKEYVPDYKDMKQVYGLGVTLDNLKKKVSNEDTFESALDGIRAFNRDKNFYTGYARNFISKTVKNNADGDDRVGYVRKASSLISSLEDLLEGKQGLMGEAASKEAVERVEKAQSLIAKFIAGSGVQDEKLAAFVQAHP